ncbi:MAG TPA: polysaccharide deacetylase family protein [Puia sp.]|jgi:peptidoglycan/xylan/chitin deacetylase (PgdA/CDA1 family)|nr:polysaccharide deacetylase family protein [Puia sp.]
MKFITTSWDDGAPYDMRLAELLTKYNLRGTFYIPKTNQEHEVMNENDILQLSKHFEIGGHTLNHKNLKTSTEEIICKEVYGSFNWIKDLTNTAPSSFCLPFGEYSKKSLEIIYNAGYHFIRTTELLSVEKNIFPFATTMQVYEHNRFVYLKHLLKRKRINNLMFWMKNGCKKKLPGLLEIYLKNIDDHGGCFHLWGHSWEIEEFKLWDSLELILQKISGLSDFRYVNNKELVFLG